MTMKKNMKIFVTVICLLAAVSAYGQDAKSQFRPIDHAVISQTIAPDARGGAMGDVGTATDPDVNSQYWNPAKYPFCISRAGLALNYTPWLRQLVNDIDLAYVAGYYRIGDYAAVSGSLRYFSLGEVMTSLEENAMTVKPYEMSLDLGASLMLSEKFALGVTLRWLYSDLRFDFENDAKPASAFAADLAGYYNNYINIGQRECQLGLGFNIQNVGTKITYFGDDRSQFLPATLRLGASLMVPVDEYNRFSIAFDASKLLVPLMPTEEMWKADDPDGTKYGSLENYAKEKYDDVSSISGIFKSFTDAPGGFKEEMQEIMWGVGAEYVYHDQFTLRAGYHHESENKGNRKYFTVGGGFRMSVFSLDVGYVISTAKSNPLDQTLRFSLAFDMDGIRDLFRR